MRQWTIDAFAAVTVVEGRLRFSGFD